MTAKTVKSIPARIPACYFVLSFCLCLFIMLSSPVTFAKETEQDTAGSVSGQTVSGENANKPYAKANRWVSKKGYSYYYNAEGKKVKGLQKIGKKRYLFDSKGRQRHGWVTVKGHVYFFRRERGKGGYMVTGKTLNRMRLKKNGKAVSSGSSRMYCLLEASRIVSSLTKPHWTKDHKLRVVWRHFQNNYKYYGDPSFSLDGDWGARYAERCFRQHHASCEGLGFAWAFLANACGANNCYCVSDTGHGWAEAEGKIYDPSWDRVDGHRYSYFGMSMSMSGHNRIPNYAANGKYKSLV